MLKYRADTSETQSDGAVVWRTVWMYGRPLAKIDNCRYASLAGDMRGTVYITGDADTFYSVPAITSIKGCRVIGYVTCDDERNLVFHHCCWL